MKNRKKGVLITNAFLRTAKFTEHYLWLRDAAARHDVELVQKENTEVLAFCGEELTWLDAYDFVIFWDKDIGLGEEITRYAAEHGIRIYNSVESIAVCDDKFETYHRLAVWNTKHPDRKVRLLPTIKAPMTYANIGYTNLTFLDTVEQRLGYPLIVKECFGSFGMQVYMAGNRSELEELTKRLAGRPFLYQKFWQESAGRDVRLQVVGDQVVAAMERCSRQGDFRANITNGGSMLPYEPSAEEQELAVRTAQILGLDFAGVDLLFDENGQAGIVCEVNSNAHFQNIHTCTGVNVADAILAHIMKQFRGESLL